MAEPPGRRRFRLDILDALARERGLESDAQIATAVGVSAPTMSKIRSGVTKPGAQFRDGVVDAFGAQWYPILFERTEELAAT